MLEVAALFYGVLASFLMASVSRNKRDARGNTPVVALLGWAMLSFSAVMGAMLIAYAAWQLLAGAAA
jgi:hypothetical protein